MHRQTPQPVVTRCDPRGYTQQMIAELVVVAMLQQWSLGPSVTLVSGSGDGIERSCLQQGYSSGVGLRLITPLLKRTTLQVVGRGYWFRRNSTCVDGFPPPDGTYVQDDRVNLMSRAFVTTDARVAIGVAQDRMTVAAGAGNAWHEGYDLPYVVLAVAWRLVDQPGVRFGFGGEYQRFRASADRVRRTYQNSQVVSEEPLGRVSNWGHAFVFSVHLDIPM